MQRIVSFVVCAAFILVCAGCRTASPAPLGAPSATAPSSSAEAATATSGGTTATATAQPTSAPTPMPTASAPASTPTMRQNSVILWHGYAVDSAEERTLIQLVERARQAQLGLAIELHRLPADQLINTFENEASAGGGPDLLLAQNDYLGREARAGLLKNIDAEMAASLGNYAAPAVQSMTVDGKLYGIPASLTIVALYYNKAHIQNPPISTQALLDAAKGGAKIALIRGMYHNFGVFGAFGGKLMDENGKCIADGGGFADGLKYLQELKAAGVQFVTSGSEAETLFKEGQIDLTIDGSWLLTDFRARLGDQLGVAPLPAGPAGQATPLVSGSGLYLNANSERAAQALAVAQFLTSAESQQQMMEAAGHVPTNPNVMPSDPAIASFVASAQAGLPRPHRPELDAFWQPFDSMLAEALETDADPVAAVQTACAAMNQANGK